MYDDTASRILFFTHTRKKGGGSGQPKAPTPRHTRLLGIHACMRHAKSRPRGSAHCICRAPTQRRSRWLAAAFLSFSCSAGERVARLLASAHFHNGSAASCSAKSANQTTDPLPPTSAQGPCQPIFFHSRSGNVRQVHQPVHRSALSNAGPTPAQTTHQFTAPQV